MKKLFFILSLVLISIGVNAQFRALWFEATQYYKLGDSTVTVWGADTLTNPAMVREAIQWYFNNVPVDSAGYADTSGYALESLKADSSTIADTSYYSLKSDSSTVADTSLYSLEAVVAHSPFYMGKFTYNSNQFAPPSSGQFRLDEPNTNLDNATTMWLSATNTDATNLSFIIDELVRAGDELYFQDATDADNKFIAFVNSRTDNTTYFTLGLDSADVDGTIAYDREFLVYVITRHEKIPSLFETDTLKSTVLIVGTDTVESLGKTVYEHVITVAKSGADYTTIEDALAAVTSPTFANRWSIEVSPGTYIENNPLTLTPYTTIVATGVRSVIIEPDNNNLDLFLDGEYTRISGVVFRGVVGTNNYAYNNNSTGIVELYDCVVRDCQNGIASTHIDAVTEVINCDFNTPISSMNRAFLLSLGELNINGVNIRSTATITTLVEAYGSNSRLSIHDLQSASPNVTTGLLLKDTLDATATYINLSNLYDGIVFSGDSVKALFTNINIVGAQNHGFRIEEPGVGVELSLFATTIIECDNLNFSVENDSCTVLGNGYTELDKSYIEPGAKFYAYLLDTKPNDEALNVLGELHVGIPEAKAESVFGGGDSYTRGMLVYQYNGTTTTYTNVTDSATAVDGDCVKFPAVTANSAIYIASTLMDTLLHHGVKIAIETAVTIGSGSIIAEYWNGTAWTAFNCMVTGSEPPYLPSAKNYFQQSYSTHIRYSIGITKDIVWRPNDPMGLGTNHKWVRFRIATAITTTCRIDQIKLHSSRTEINSDGFLEAFGDARNIQRLNLNIGLARRFEGNLQSQTIYVDQDIGVGFQENRFLSSTDKVGYSIKLPRNIDTGSPVYLVFSGRYLTGGTAQWTVRWRRVQPSQTLYTTEPTSSGLEKTTTTTSRTVTAGISEMFQIQIDVSDFIARRTDELGDQLWLSIQPSTLPGNFDITNISSSYYVWGEGGHY